MIPRDAVTNVVRELERARDQLSTGDYAYVLKRVRKLVDEERNRLARASDPIAGQLALDESSTPRESWSQVGADEPWPEEMF